MRGSAALALLFVAGCASAGDPGVQVPPAGSGPWKVALEMDELGSVTAIVMAGEEGVRSVAEGEASFELAPDGTLTVGGREARLTRSALADGAWRASFAGEIDGSFTATVYEGPFPARDYGAILQQFDAIVGRALFDPRQTRTAAWLDFRSAFGERAVRAADDLDLLLAFENARADAALFSHFDLRFQSRTLEQMRDESDAAAESSAVATFRESDGIGVIRIRSFFGDAILKQINDTFDQALAAHADALVVDLRGNPGGTFAAWPVLARITSRPITAGYLVAAKWYEHHDAPPTAADIASATPVTVPDPQTLRGNLMDDGLLVLGVEPREPGFRGPVYLLIDEGSRSTTEIVAGALQHHGLVTVVGERSAGEVVNANLVPLDEGMFLLLPIADFRLPNGLRVEGVGIKPDVSAAADAALECARRMAVTGAVDC